MGIYLNPGSEGFRSRRKKTYVDKTGMIALINERIGSSEKLVCICRPRRSGKSTAAQMLAAYYGCGQDEADLFDDLEIAKDPSYKEHLNRYNVLYLDITAFMNDTEIKREDVLSTAIQLVKEEIAGMYPEVEIAKTLAMTLANVVAFTGRKFVAIIDEWDALMRDGKASADVQTDYLQFLRSLFKNSGLTDKVFAAAYMTGILPIKKDGTQSAVSEFEEFDMIHPRGFQEYVGFTESEVRQLCEEKGVDFDTMRAWYDGYSFGEGKSIYNPNSVIKAINNKSFESYWNMSSSAGSILSYIDMDFDGLSDAIWQLMSGGEIGVEVDGFRNDLVSFSSKDDVLTLLIHYGYFSYDCESETIRIPNEEIRREFASTLWKSGRAETIRRVKESVAVIDDTVNEREDAVAERLERIHSEECAPLFYNNEQSLRSVIKMAYFAYKDYYIKFEELPSGKGYADIVYLPKKKSMMPALVVELKSDDVPEAAIAQIKERNYPASIRDFGGGILLVGISYRKKDGKHFCRIERLEKG